MSELEFIGGYLIAHLVRNPEDCTSPKIRTLVQLARNIYEVMREETSKKRA